MSMIAHLRIVAPSIIDTLADYDDEEMVEFLFPDDESSDTTQDLDKSWDAIGHLLAAATSGSLSTLLGGAEVGPDLGYGPARFIAPDEVRVVAAALEAVDRDDLLSHFNAGSLMKGEVYPGTWEDSYEDREYIGQNYDVARSVFLAAARKNAGVLVLLA